MALSTALATAACAASDSRAAKQAETSLVGLSELEIVTCLGVPNRSVNYGPASVLSYDGMSTNSGGLTLTLPVVSGVSFSGGGYCHLAVRLDGGRVTALRYTGETDAPFAPAAYCAPLVRSCLAYPPPATSLPPHGALDATSVSVAHAPSPASGSTSNANRAVRTGCPPRLRILPVTQSTEHPCRVAAGA